MGEIQKNLASSLQNMVLIGKQAVNWNIKFLFDEFTCQKVGVQVGVAPLVQEVGLVYPVHTWPDEGVVPIGQHSSEILGDCLSYQNKTLLSRGI